MSLKHLLPGLGLLLPGLAFAELELGKTWINAGFYSAHFERDKGLEDFNPGLGFEYPLNDMLSLTAGGFRNSDRRHSNYVGLYVMPFEFYGVKLGAVVGGFDGYQRTNDGGWFPAIIPTAAIEGSNWGLNIAFIPSIKDRLYGAISFQLKYRFTGGGSRASVPEVAHAR